MTDSERFQWIVTNLGNVSLKRVTDSNFYDAHTLGQTVGHQFHVSWWVNGETLAESFGDSAREAFDKMVQVSGLRMVQASGPERSDPEKKTT